MIISAIVAVAQNNVIGDSHSNTIPWYLPADLKYFKNITLGHPVVMGRKCFESIGRPLPKRTNIIITRDPFYIVSGCIIAHNIEEALEIAIENAENDEIFIIGGAEIYRESMEYWDKLYLTKVDIMSDGDIFFPTLDSNEWVLSSETQHFADEKNEMNYTFNIFERRQAVE